MPRRYWDLFKICEVCDSQEYEDFILQYLGDIHSYI